MSTANTWTWVPCDQPGCKRLHPTLTRLARTSRPAPTDSVSPGGLAETASALLEVPERERLGRSARATTALTPPSTVPAPAGSGAHSRRPVARALRVAG